jgi:ubiquinone/menaquinone biosynthesis C-methylase UbiE
VVCEIGQFDSVFPACPAFEMQMTLEGISADQIRSLSYVELLANLKESNRPPGGISTLRRLIINCHLKKSDKVLHFGCNAGFLSRETARIIGCKVTGVDISNEMVEAANAQAVSNNLSGVLNYQRQDVRKLSFEDEMFDVSISGGALAFVNGHVEAIKEVVRVTKPFGFVGDAHLYYRDSINQKLRDKVAEIIGVPVPEYTYDYWKKIFSHGLLENYYEFVAPVEYRSDNEVRTYCERMVEFSAPNLRGESREALFDRLLAVFSAFNENMKHMSYVIYVFRRLPISAEPSLFS